MTDFSTEDRQAICETFERLLSSEYPEDNLRKIIETPSGFDRPLWGKMAELGLTGLMVLPDHGGIGGTIEEVEALMDAAPRWK